MVTHSIKRAICLYCGDNLRDAYSEIESEDRPDFIFSVCSSILKYLEDKGVNCGRCNPVFRYYFDDIDMDDVYYNYDAVLEPIFMDYDIYYEKVENIFFDGIMIYLVI